MGFCSDEFKYLDRNIRDGVIRFAEVETYICRSSGLSQRGGGGLGTSDGNE